MGGNLGAVRSLLAHPAFAMSNPNMCYSMFLSFLRSTPTFHAADGSGYEFLADSILQARTPPLLCLSCQLCWPALLEAVLPPAGGDSRAMFNGLKRTFCIFCIVACLSKHCLINHFHDSLL